MSSSRWDRIEELFERALPLSGVERSELVKSWGEFTPDTTPLADIAAQRPAAVKIMETVNFDG